VLVDERGGERTGDVVNAVEKGEADRQVVLRVCGTQRAREAEEVS
jgi:hypothetical protein